MARTYNITDGAARTVNLISITGIIPPRGGFGSVKLAPHAYDAGAAADKIVVERWRLNLIATSHDNATTQLAALLDLLRDAWRYHKDPLFNDPIYITQQTTGETGTRYALVHQAPEISNPDFFNHPFEADNLIEDMGIAIARGPWRSAAPGVKGSALTLTAAQGPANPTLVNIANHRDDHAIDTIFRLDQGAVWAADFELGDPDFMWHADNAALSTGDIDFFIAGFFDAESLAADGGLIAKWNGLAAGNEYKLEYDVGGNRFQFSIYSGAAADTVVANNFGAPAISTLYFIVGWHIAASSEIGISVNLVEDTAISAINPQDSNGIFTLGAAHTAAVARYFDGLGRSCGMWKAECTAALRACLYNNGTPKFYAELSAAELAGLQGYWEFGSGGLAFVNDSAGANNLTNAGATQIVGTAQAWSGNQIAVDPHNIFPAVPAVGDTYFIGSDEPFFHVVFNLGTAGVYTSLGLQYEYSTNICFANCTVGDDITTYPDDEPWNQTGLVLVNFSGHDDWDKKIVNAVNKFWLAVRITSCVAFNVPPANATVNVYNHYTPHIEIPATLLKGDVPPYLLMRMRSPAGGDDDPEMSTNSLVLMGAKSRGLTKFVSHLNLGGDGNPGDWVVSVADPPCKDASIVACGASPGGDRVDVDFATTASLTTRVRITGTNILEYWRGHYRPFLRAQQIGGAAGDISLRLRVFIDSTDAYSPKYDTTKLGVPMVGVTKGMELVELMPEGILQLPFAGIEAADEAGLANANLIFDIQAARPSGAATLRIYDLILLPSDEWACGLIDPISDSLTGNSALRGLSLLDLDGGVIANRTVKQLINGSNILMAETWSRGGDRPRLQPLTQTRIYFIFGHYSGAFGTPPYISTLGMHLTYELYGQNCYLFLRGSG